MARAAPPWGAPNAPANVLAAYSAAAAIPWSARGGGPGSDCSKASSAGRTSTEELAGHRGERSIGRTEVEGPPYQAAVSAQPPDRRDLVEIVVVPGHPVHRNHRTIPFALQHPGDGSGRQRFGHGVSGTGEESRLLAGRHDQRPGGAETGEDLRRARSGDQRGSERVVPVPLPELGKPRCFGRAGCRESEGSCGIPFTRPAFVIRLAPENRPGSIPLLQHDHAGQLVGQRQRTQAPAGRARRVSAGVEAVGAADHQRHRRVPASRHASSRRPAPRSTTRPRPVQRDDLARRADGRLEPGGLLATPFGGRRRPAGLLDFPFVDLP